MKENVKKALQEITENLDMGIGGMIIKNSKKGLTKKEHRELLNELTKKGLSYSIEGRLLHVER